MKTLTNLFLGIAILASGSLYAQSPDLLWAYGFGNSEYDVGKSVCTDSDGNLIVTGGFKKTVDFDPGAGEVSFSSYLDSEDIYLIKYDPNGAVIWAHVFSSYHHERGECVETDADGNIYLTGRFFGTVDFDPSDDVYELTAIGGSSDVFVMKLDTDGDFLWARSFGSSMTNQGIDLAISPSGDVHVTGSFIGTVDFDPGPGIYELTSVTDAPSSIYTVKLNASGDFEWASMCGGDSGNTFGFGVALDAAGSVYTIGSFGGTGDFDPSMGTETLVSNGYDDIFIQKLDAAGNFDWALNLGGGYGEWADDIVVNSDDDLVITGYFRQTVDFDPGPGVAELTSTGSDLFVLKMDTDGNYIWAGMAGGASTESRGLGITTDEDNNMYVTGYYSGAVDFDPGAGTEELTSIGGRDIFVLKWDTDGAYQWVKTMGSDESEFGGAEIALEGEDVYVVGGFSSTCNFNPEGDANDIESAGSGDIFMLKLGICAIDNGATQDGLTLSATQDGAMYQWLDCNDDYAVIDGETAQSMDVMMDGNYAVQITMGACVDTSDCLAIAGIGLEEILKSNIVVFPNPAKEMITITTGDVIKNVFIYDLSGQVLINDNQANISLVDLASGVYLIQIETELNNEVIRFIKE